MRHAAAAGCAPLGGRPAPTRVRFRCARVAAPASGRRLLRVHLPKRQERAAVWPSGPDALGFHCAAASSRAPAWPARTDVPPRRARRRSAPRTRRGST